MIIYYCKSSVELKCARQEYVMHREYVTRVRISAVRDTYSMEQKIAKYYCFSPLLDWQISTYFLGRTLILYIFTCYVIYFIFILLRCYHDILQLQKWPSKDLNWGHMIQICIARSTTKPTRSVTAWIVHRPNSAPYFQLLTCDTFPEQGLQDSPITFAPHDHNDHSDGRTRRQPRRWQPRQRCNYHGHNNSTTMTATPRRVSRYDVAIKGQIRPDAMS
jgi:hypothetical protein